MKITHIRKSPKEITQSSLILNNVQALLSFVTSLSLLKCYPYIKRLKEYIYTPLPSIQNYPYIFPKMYPKLPLFIISHKNCNISTSKFDGVLDHLIGNPGTNINHGVQNSIVYLTRYVLREELIEQDGAQSSPLTLGHHAVS